MAKSINTIEFSNAIPNATLVPIMVANAYLNRQIIALTEAFVHKGGLNHIFEKTESSSGIRNEIRQITIRPFERTSRADLRRFNGMRAQKFHPRVTKTTKREEYP